MVSTLKENVQKLVPIYTRDLGGGLNTLLAPAEIQDNECVELLNMAFEQDKSLTTRLGTTKQNTSPATFNGRITSLYSAVFSTGATNLLLTTTNDIFSESPEGTFTSIKGAASLASDVFWHWKTFNNLAIGANGQTTGSGHMNPCKWTGSGNIAQLADGGGNSPKGKYLEVWNRRLWLVDADNPNRLYYSKLEDPDNWTTGGGYIDININDGDIITAIYAHRGFLFIFKRNRIYRIITGEPNTDATKWSVALFASNIGCISQWTIQSVLDDVIFLSDQGVFSLQAAEIVGDFKAGSLSKNIPEITDYLPTATNVGASIINEDESQYWLALRSSTSGTENGVVWIMDYKSIKDGLVRWARWEGGPVGCSYCIHIRNQIKRVMIGGIDSNRILQRYGDAAVYTDNAALYTKKVRTKAFNLGDPMTREQFNEFAMYFENISSTCALSIEVRLDEDEAKKKSYSETLVSSSSGATYGSSSGTTYSTSTTSKHIIRHHLLGSQGNRGLSLQFVVSNATSGQAFKWRYLSIDQSQVNKKQIGGV